MHFATRRQCEVKCRASGIVWRRRYSLPVRFNDRTAYGETHPHAILLSRIERIEKTLGVFQCKSGTGVLNSYEHIFWIALRAPYDKLSRSQGGLVHGLDCVEKQV